MHSSILSDHASGQAESFLFFMYFFVSSPPESPRVSPRAAKAEENG